MANKKVNQPDSRKAVKGLPLGSQPYGKNGGKGSGEK